MAYTPCIIGGGGGQYTETSLWTNESPTSAFASQTITLSESIDNYSYIKIRYRLSTTDDTEVVLIVTSSDLKKSLSGSNHFNLDLGGRDSSTTWARIILYSSNTSLLIQPAYRINGASSSNAALIPLEILGLNELDTGERKCDVGSVTAVANTVVAVTLGYKPKQISLTFNPNPSDTNADKMTFVYDENISSGYVIRSLKQNTSTIQCSSYAIANATPLILNDDGFSVNIGSSTWLAGTWHYFAIG